MQLTVVVLFGVSCLLFADIESRQRVQVTHTQRADFPSGGLLRLRHSTGELTIEGWDRPDVEITTTQSSKADYSPQDREKAAHELDRLRLSVERQGAELVVTANSPRRVDLWCNIKAPINARLAVEHGSGEVHVDNLTSDIHVTVANGAITLHLPQEGKYNIDAKTRIGGVQSDFPGEERRRPWLLGHRYTPKMPSAHNLYLRAGVGDITILKIRTPVEPVPLAH